jgi:TonB family protein
MSGSLLWNNLAAYSVQIGLLVAIAAVIPAALRLRAPAARLAYWHVLLAACLALPLLRPWQSEAITLVTPVLNSAAHVSTAPVGHPAARDFDWYVTALWVLAGGLAVRLGLLAIGLWRLRRYRLHSAPFATAYDADIRISGEVSSPVTFGARHPVILVPERFPELPAAMQQAILCHEILHIERRDWLFTMAEELVRAVFWFHPAVWWVLGEIQLAREQTVDLRVVEITSAREPYVDALLTMAGARPQLDLAPAPLFLRKRHLKQRVMQILKEANMSRKRLIPSLALAFAALAAACWFVTGAVPLAAAPQTVADGSGVTVNLNGARLMHRSAVTYPRDAVAKGVQGTVVVQVKLDANGEVTDASVLSGPDELRKSVLESVLSWHFMKDSAGTTRTVNVDFVAPEKPPAAAPSVVATPEMEKYSAAVEQQMPPAMTQTHPLKSIEVVGLSDQARDELLARLPVHEGDSISMIQMGPISRAVHDYDSHLSASLSMTADGSTLHILAPGASPRPVPGGVLGGMIGRVPASAAPPEPPTSGSAAPNPQRIRVGGAVQAANLVSQTPPEYPPLALQARISGTVQLAAIIGKDGHVQDLSVVRGHPLLVQPALDAVKTWVYKPTLLNGQPVEVSTTIDVNFTLP